MLEDAHDEDGGLNLDVEAHSGPWWDREAEVLGAEDCSQLLAGFSKEFHTAAMMVGLINRDFIEREERVHGSLKKTGTERMLLERYRPVVDKGLEGVTAGDLTSWIDKFGKRADEVFQVVGDLKVAKDNPRILPRVLKHVMPRNYSPSLGVGKTKLDHEIAALEQEGRSCHSLANAFLDYGSRHFKPVIAEESSE